MNDQIKKANIDELVKKGTEVYDRVKDQYEPRYNGKFLVIEPDSEKVYLGDTSAEALVKARQENPNKLFYAAKIGFEAAETIASAWNIK